MQKLEKIVKKTEYTWKQISLREQSLHDFNAHTFDEIIDESSATQSDTITFIDESAHFFNSNRTEELKIQRDVINKKINNVKKTSQRHLSNTHLKLSIIKQLLQDLLSYVTISILDYDINRKIIYDTLSSGKVISSTTLLHTLQQLRQVVKTKKLDLPFNEYDEWTTKFYDIVTMHHLK